MKKTAVPSQTTLGHSLRYWRKAKKVSQLDLAFDANVSARHLSFIETGKSQPSREVVLSLANALNLTLKQSNGLLTAAGYTPEYDQFGLDKPQMTQVKYALKRLLKQNEPFPAMVLNQDYDLLMANQGFYDTLSKFIDPETLTKYTNFLQLAFAKDGLQPYFLDWPNVKAFFLARLQQETLTSQNPYLQDLLTALKKESSDSEDLSFMQAKLAEFPILSFELKKEKSRLHFFSMMTTFGAAQDISVAELRIETLFPADEETRQHFFSSSHEGG